MDGKPPSWKCCRQASVYATDANAVCKSGIEADALAIEPEATNRDRGPGSHFESSSSGATMSPKMTERMVPAVFALVVTLVTGWQAQALDAKTPYPTMAPLEQYLITDRNAEITLARSAAPDSISRDAEILVLGPHGYEAANKGKNGFVCG